MKREFPDHPLVGVGGVVIRRNRVLLIRRGSEPLKGQWSLPGGMLELGEELADGVRREIKEETGLEVEPLSVIEVFDRIMLDGQPFGVMRLPAGQPARTPRSPARSRDVSPKTGQVPPRVRYHYVIVDYACRLKGGRLTPGSDVLDARWVRGEDLPEYHLTAKATSVIHQAFRLLNSRVRRGAKPASKAVPAGRRKPPALRLRP